MINLTSCRASFCAVLIFFSSGLHAALSSQSEEQTLRAIEIDTRFSPGQILVYVNEQITFDNCTNSHRYAFSYDEGGKALLPILMAAKATGSSVQFNVDGCQDGVPKIKIVRAN